MISIVSVPACFSYLGQAAKFVAHLVGPYQFINIDYVYVSKTISVVLKWISFSISSTAIVSFLGSMPSN